mmetsp:Transcript_13307/g.55895  ORF Transcript_13307/g.55895 Transcript_13307/m.55895 type:complete len:233 (+) Transcript_13307:589-1287(+)
MSCFALVCSTTHSDPLYSAPNTANPFAYDAALLILARPAFFSDCAMESFSSPGMVGSNAPKKMPIAAPRNPPMTVASTDFTTQLFIASSIIICSGVGISTFWYVFGREDESCFFVSGAPDAVSGGSVGALAALTATISGASGVDVDAAPSPRASASATRNSARRIRPPLLRSRGSASRGAGAGAGRAGRGRGNGVDAPLESACAARKSTLCMDSISERMSSSRGTRAWRRSA